MSKWRRFEVLLPLKFNDGRPVPRKRIGEAIREITEQFGASSFERQTIEGHWVHEGVLYQDKLVRIFVDVPDNAKNRAWMKKYRARWRQQLDQLDIWMVSYRIEVE